MDNIEEQATIDAKNDFLAIDRGLEHLKNKVRQFNLKEDKVSLIGIGLLTAGIFLGTKVPRPLTWLAGYISGSISAFCGVSVLFDIFESPEKKDVSLTEALENYQEYEPDNAKF